MMAIVYMHHVNGAVVCGMVAYVVTLVCVRFVRRSILYFREHVD